MLAASGRKHIAPGGPAWAGGVPITTPFGTVYGSNLTPAPLGLGGWTSSDFWRALHHGQSKDGRLLNPAFPYPNTTHISRADSDALFAWLRSRPAVVRPNRPHELRFPYNQQAALAVWRALYFRPEVFRPDPGRGEVAHRTVGSGADMWSPTGSVRRARPALSAGAASACPGRYRRSRRSPPSV